MIGEGDERAGWPVGRGVGRGALGGQRRPASRMLEDAAHHLGIVGSRDPLQAAVREVQKLRPDMKVVVIEGATHGGSSGAPRRPEFVAALREFLATR